MLPLLAIGCDESAKVAPSTTAPIGGAEKPSQVSYHTTMNFSSNGLLRAILHAGRVQTFEARQFTLMDSGVTVDFYNRDGKHSSTLTSQSAHVNTANNNMMAYGFVHIVSDSGTVVDTDSLNWDNKEQMLRSSSPVHIVEKSGRKTDGVGFESDQNLEHYHILHPIILAPPGSYETRTPNSNQNALKPETPAVPGAGALTMPSLGHPGSDSSAPKK